MSNPVQSIIIVSWNTLDLLRDCLCSVRASAGVVCETIVVDNGSSDGTPEMLASEFPEVHVIQNEENRGFAAANNQGIAVAAGNYLLLLNSDTLVAADALARLGEFMEAHPDAGACGPQLRNPDGTLQPSGRALPSLWQGIIALLPMPPALRRALADRIERRDYTRVSQVGEVSGAALFLRRTAIAQVGGLDEAFFFLGEDVDLCWRLGEAGWNVYYVPQALVTHLWGGSRARLEERMSLLAQRAEVLLFRKHRPGLPVAIINGLAFLLTILKGLRRVLAALVNGDRTRAVESWRLHRDELGWLVGR